jgi:hypothetical protein
MCTSIFCKDIWWHLKTGENILTTGTVPRQDIFTFTCSDRPWVNLHWLYQIVQYLFYRVGGFCALILSKATIITLVAILALIPAIRKGRWLGASFLLLIASFILNWRAILRPEIYSYLFLVLYLLISEKQRNQETRLIYALPLLQILWVNMQGLFILGLMVTGVYMVDEILSKIREPQTQGYTTISQNLLCSCGLKVFVMCVFASFLNLYGVEGVLFPLVLFTRIDGSIPIFRDTITEFHALWEISSHAWPTYISFILLSLCPIALSLFDFSSLRLRHILLYFLFLYLALIAVRNIVFFTLVSLLFSSLWLKATIFSRISLSLRIGGAILLLLVLSFLGYTLLTQSYYPYFHDARQFGFARLSPGRYPEKAADFLLKEKIAGKIFHHINDGGYLIWRLFPHHKVFIDSRLEVMGHEHLAIYQKMCHDRYYFEKMTSHYGIDLAMVREQAVYEALFAGNPRWEIIFQELAVEGSVILKRKAKK